MSARRKVFVESDYGSPNEQKKLEQLITLISGINFKAEKLDFIILMDEWSLGTKVFMIIEILRFLHP